MMWKHDCSLKARAHKGEKELSQGFCHWEGKILGYTHGDA